MTARIPPPPALYRLNVAGVIVETEHSQNVVIDFPVGVDRRRRHTVTDIDGLIEALHAAKAHRALADST